LSSPYDRYRQTFRQHRVLFCMPIVIALLISVWYALGAPKSYQSTANVWFDNTAPGASSLTQTDPTARPPAAQKQLLLTELLATRDFRLTVGRKGPLAAYLATHKDTGFGPTALLSKLQGASSVDDRTVSALGSKQVTSVVSGPQVLEVAYKGPDPAVAAGTLSALIDEFKRQDTAALSAKAQANVDYYKSQVDSASKAFSLAQSNITDYLSTHPSRPDPDLNLTTLTEAATVASTQLSDATSKWNQGNVDLAHVEDANSYRVIDAPRAPAGPVGGKKRALLAVLAGLFAGALVSLLGVIAVTSRNEARWRERQESDARLGSGDALSAGATAGQLSPASAELAAVEEAPAPPPESLPPTRSPRQIETVGVVVDRQIVDRHELNRPVEEPAPEPPDGDAGDRPDLVSQSATEPD